MGTARKLLVTPIWQYAIDQFDKELTVSGAPRSTRRLRSYHLRSLAHDHRHSHASPWEITRQDLVDWLAAHDWAPETRRSIRSSLRMFYEWAQSAGHVDASPAATLPKVSVPMALPRPAPDDVVDDGLRAPDPRARLAILIMTLTGIRRAECAQLHTDDLMRDLTGWSLRIVGKGGRERYVPMDPDLAAELRNRAPGFIFPGRIDGHLSADYLGKLVSRALADGWTAHTLRHRFATRAYAVERDIRAVQELLGHAKVTTTQVYTFVPEDAMRRAARGAKAGLAATESHLQLVAGGEPAPPAETPKATTLPQPAQPTDRRSTTLRPRRAVLASVPRLRPQASPRALPRPRSRVMPGSAPVPEAPPGTGHRPP